MLIFRGWLEKLVQNIFFMLFNKTDFSDCVLGRVEIIDFLKSQYLLIRIFPNQLLCALVIYIC